MQIPEEISKAIAEIQGLMADVATRMEMPAIHEENRYKELFESIEDFCKEKKISHKNAFSSLKEWRGYAMTNLPTYRERRDYVKSLYQSLDATIDSNKESKFNSSNKPQIELNKDKSIEISKKNSRKPFCQHWLFQGLIVGILVYAITFPFQSYKNRKRLINQIIMSLYSEFQDNKPIWDNNYQIVDQDRGGLQQNTREEFLKKNERWTPLRPLDSFSFKAWEDVKVNHSDLLNKALGNNYSVFSQYYKALRDVQNYIDVRQEYLTAFTSTGMVHDASLQRFELLNQNVISSMEKHKEKLEKVEDYFQNFSEITLNTEYILQKGAQVIIEAPVTGDTVSVRASGASILLNKIDGQ